MTPRGQNNIKTGHGIPQTFINQKQTPLHQGVWDEITSGVKSAVNSVSNYFGGEEEKSKKNKINAEQLDQKAAAADYNQWIKPSFDKKASIGDKNGTITLDRGSGWKPGLGTLVEKLPAYKGDVNSIKNLQKSKVPEIKSAVNESVDYWQNPEVQKMYLKNHPEYKGDVKKMKQDINTMSANGAKYEFVKVGDKSIQNGQVQTVGGFEDANTFYPGYNREYKRKPGKPRVVEDVTQGNWFNNKSKNGIISYNPFDKDIKSTAKHEFPHASGFDAAQGAVLGKTLGTPNSDNDYMARPDEMYGNFTMFKSKMGLKPGQRVNAKQFKKIVEEKGLQQENFYRQFKDNRILRAINTVADNGDKKGLEKKNKIQSMGDSMNA